MAIKNDAYALHAPTTGTFPAPELPYEPRQPQRYSPAIGLIACGGITHHHLTAYRAAGFRVVALCDLVLARAKRRRDEFYPEADVYRDYRKLLARDDIEVVDIATHPPERPKLIRDALQARKHVLSQKPFVLDLDLGARLADLADRKGVRLAVNQNGRWAPYFSYIRQAIAAEMLGHVNAAHLSVHWDHTWVKGTIFETIKHLILYDFAIHWFDILHCFLGDRPARRVFAQQICTQGQPVRPPMLGQAMFEFDDAQASLTFDADTHFGPQERTYVTGSRGTIQSLGPDSKHQTVTLWTDRGQASPALTGAWFSDGFRGTMGELLSAIDENREPTNSARDNLHSLELCFAAVASAERHEPVVPGTVRRLPRAKGWTT
jgi:predicted dehydrogenase